MAPAWNNAMVSYALVFMFHLMSVNTTPVIIDPPEIIQPRLPENLCFIESLDEGGKFDYNIHEISQLSNLNQNTNTIISMIYLYHDLFQVIQSSLRIVLRSADSKHLQSKSEDSLAPI